MPYTDNSVNKGTTNWLTATSVAAATQNATYSGWGLALPSPSPPQQQQQPHSLTTNNSSSLWSSIIAPTTANKTLADFVKESAAWHSPLSNAAANQQQQHNHQQISAATSMPWAAAVKAPSSEHPQQQQHHQQQQQHHHASISSSISSNLSSANAFDCNSTIGSWSSPETSSSNRGGWNADGLNKNNGAFDDGTAIWGNPSTKKTGIDWTEKESLSNPPQASSIQEKRAQKPEPVISSINGTEAWGAPANSALFKQSTPNSNNIINSNNSSSSNCSQQQAKLNDNSGNIYGSSTANESLSWGEASSLKAKNENSSPPSNSVWNTSATSAPNHINNNNNIGKQRSSDWLASSSTVSSSASIGINPWIDELNKELEATSLFDANSLSSSTSSSLAKNSSSPSSLSNSNLDNQSSAIGACLANGIIGTNSGTIGVSLGSGSSNAINDLKQTMGANNFSNNSLSASNNPQSQNNSCAFSMGVTPSRDLLKQMVHQIQLAVQAGHLNAHILNQPMSTPTLQLVYTLLQQIKLLHQFQEIQQRSVNKSSDINSPSNLDLQISRVQQNISLLQRAITQQQAALTKNQTTNKRNIDAQVPTSSFNSSTLGGLSLQSNPWLFAPSGDSRPAPPPGLMNSNNFGSIIGNSSNVNGTNDANSNKHGLSSENESHLQSRESSSSLWSGAWFD